MLAIIPKRKIWYAVSAVLLVASFVFIALGGLRLSIDFTGGTLIRLSFVDRPPVGDVSAVVQASTGQSSHVQTIGENKYAVRLGPIDNDMHQALQSSLQERFSDVREDSFEVIGPVIGTELRQKSIIAIILVVLGIIGYLIWAFRGTGGLVRSWQFGLNAILALLHDITITIGFFAVLGYYFNVEIDVLFITALLTILGFSVHDTIVVFDRIREGLKTRSDDLEQIANDSVNQTLVRSLNTSTTTLLVLVALLFFGGSSIYYFVLALIVGVVVGTYSSIFIASPLLVTFARK